MIIFIKTNRNFCWLIIQHRKNIQLQVEFILILAVSPIKLLKNEPEYLNNIPLLDEKKPDSQIFKKIIRRNTRNI